MQVFDCGFITFKMDVNIFERMYIAESIYKGVLEPYHKNYWCRFQSSWSHQAKESRIHLRKMLTPIRVRDLEIPVKYM